MTNNTTKRALISSAMALFLCFVMLIGTTFAWFTDTASSTGNVIKTGTLEVELWQHFADGSSVNISENSDPIFGAENSTSANAESINTLWEPGKTQTVYLSIKNNGTLDLKYTVAIEVTNITNNLNEVLTYIITPDATYGTVTKANLDFANDGTAVNPGINFATEGDVALGAGLEHFFALSVHMDELAGNEYQNSNITFNIKVLAGQLASEEDSFDNQYDANATYPDGFVTIPESDPSAAGYEFPYFDGEGNKIGTITVPATALPEGATGLVYTVTPNAVDPNFTPAAGANAYAFDITVIGLVEGNTTPILTEVRIDKGLTGDVVVYHHLADGTAESVQVESYNPETGMVRFYTTSFSPFTVVEVEKAPATDSILPGAILEACPEYVNNSEIVWQSYGQWSPTSGLEANLDACYKFIAPHTAETVENCEYKDWWVDFVLELDAPLGADGKTNEIFLGGNYGSWGWVGFHSGDLQLDPNTEVPVLASASGRSDDRESGWTYEDIVKYVGEFTCGVGNVGDSLKGATITVTLRLTNPDNLAEHYDVNTVPYTFQ